MFGVPPPPPPPGAPPPPGGIFGAAPDGSVTIKGKIRTKYRLPLLNWVAFKPNQIGGTVFSELDDTKVMKDINFENFEEMFKTQNQSAGNFTAKDGPKKSPSKKKQQSLLDPNRLQNISIMRRKIELTVKQIVEAIKKLDLNLLELDTVEQLQRFLPNDGEVKVFKQYEKDKKPIEQLTEEDRLMISLSKVERLSDRLAIMSFMGNFDDTIKAIKPQLNAITSASLTIKTSARLKKILEIVLAFGNYLNSAKRGAAYGFKLQSLDTLLDTKSTDRSMTLLHYIVETVHQKFPGTSDFCLDLQYVEKAAAVSLENLVIDIRQLTSGIQLSKREFAQQHDNSILRDFLLANEDKVKKVDSDMKKAEEAYNEAVGYYGENPKMCPPSTFFSLFQRFVNAYKKAEADNEHRKKQKEAALETAANIEAAKKSRKQKDQKKVNQDAMVLELQKKHRNHQDKRREASDGAIENIISDLKNEPYRRADGIRRSLRRKQQENLRPTILSNEMVI
ncbi:formin-like protein 3 [Patiria miniata]|uniref:Formin-like protein n=1 Tax=Patiria miniata TaxID=46514 RepID=A0A913YZF0_PATMI|nr:formin-like protein 3 [Patiria miniata]